MRGKKGAMLAELLIALVVTTFFIGTLFQGVIGLHNCVCRWDRSMRMRQSMMATLFRVSGDLRMAGCNPWGSSHFDAIDLGTDAQDRKNRLTILLDKRGTDPDSSPDGDVRDPDERIEYRWDTGKGILRRNGQPVIMEMHENPRGIPFVDLEERNGYGMVKLMLTTNNQDETCSLSTIVCIRNPL